MSLQRFKLVIEDVLVKWCLIWLFLFLNLCYDVFFLTATAMATSGSDLVAKAVKADNRRMTEEDSNH